MAKVEISFCSSCLQDASPLFEVSNATSGIFKQSNDFKAVKQKICSECIIGKNVPVKLDNGKWQFGEVLLYDNDTMKFKVQFLRGDIEWVVVDEQPLERYFEAHRGRNRRAKVAAEDWFATEFFAPTLPTKGDSMWRNQQLANLFHFDHEPLSENWILNKISTNPSFSPMRSPSPEFCVDNAVTRTPIRQPNEENPVVCTPPSSHYKSPRRSPARLWSIEDDDLLLRLVNSSGKPVKWSEIAKAIPERNGKQCRERYLNHLRKEVKVDAWTPVEDAIICHLYRCYGTKWSLMTKTIHLEGRSDNGIKNRFHHIRRKLEKDWNKENLKRKRTSSDPEDVERKEEYTDILSKAVHVISKLASDPEQKPHGFFGPFVETEHRICSRCHLIVPSIQTGKLICKKTAWCISCASTPAYVVTDTLRECHMKRKDVDEKA